MVTSRKRRAPATEESYVLRCLSTPMRLSATGELCSRTFIPPGTTLTIGRSKKGCNVTFEDARVSRRHCQLHLLPDSSSLVLTNGATMLSNGICTSLIGENRGISGARRCIFLSQTRLDTPDNGNTGSHSSQKPKSMSKYLPESPKEQFGRRIRKNVPNTKALEQFEEKHSNIQDLPLVAIGHYRGDGKKRHYDLRASTSSSTVFHHNVATNFWKPSLNGIFVNGHIFKEKMMILMPGDEVSLVGPTEGGKSLDIDCPKAIGFVVEIQPPLMKAQLATKCLSLQVSTKQIVGDDYPASVVCSTANMSDHNKRLGLHNGESAEPDILSKKLLGYNHSKFDVKQLGGSESDASVGDSSTAFFKNSGFGDAIIGRVLSPSTIDKLESRKIFAPTQAAQVKQTTCSINLDSKFLSTFNLVKASIQLRSDLLNTSTAESSHSFVGLEEPLLVDAKEKFHFSQKGNVYQTSIQRSNSLMEYRMPNVSAAEDVCCMLRENQRGDYVFEIQESHTLGDMIKMDTSLCQQAILPENFGVAVNEKGVAGLLSSVLVCKDGIPLKASVTRDQINKDVDSNAPHRMRTLLASETNSLGDTLENACCKMKVFDCSHRFVNMGNPFQEAGNENFSKDVCTEFHTLAEKEFKCGVGQEIAKEGTYPKPAHANDIFGLMLEPQIGDSRAATVSPNVFQPEEEPSGEQACLKKEDMNFLQCANEGKSAGGLIQGQIVKDGVCDLEEKETWDLQNCDQIHKDIAELEVADASSHSCLAGGEAPKFMIPDEGHLNGDQIFSVAKIESGIENERFLEERVRNDELRMSDLVDTSDIQFKHTGAVQELETQKMIYNMHWPQPFGGGLCTSGLPAAEMCYLDTASLKNGGLYKGEALQRVLEPVSKSSAASQDHGDIKPTINACLEQACNDSREGNAATEVAIEQFKSFCRHDSNCTQSPISDACLEQVFDASRKGHAATDASKEQSQRFLRHDLSCIQSMVNDAYPKQVCDSLREGNAAIEVVLDHSKSSHSHDSTCNHRLTVETQVDEVKKLVPNKKTYNSGTAGYYLNQLKDATTGAPINQDNTVCLWDLLALTDEVQALFIATFTYDLEWFLYSGGLPRDIPVTVACHNAKRCWSVASKDRCEKPYLDWPNVTVVYPPFPRSNAFGKGQGIGCHHPKIFLLRRTESLRVIVSSANLTSKQWFHVTNNVWWQDFPCRQTPDFRCLFQGDEKTNSTAAPDFAAQLAIFLAALLVDAPSEAHWVTDLAVYDFSDAAGSLVASVPGLHQPLYQNAPQFLTTLNKDAYSPSVPGNDFVQCHLGVVPTRVVGIRYRFGAFADRNGTRIRSLAAVLNDVTAHQASTMPVLLKRAKFLKADPNAVSVIVTSQAKGCSQDLFLQEDLHNAEINTMESDTLHIEEGFIKLGFLPRDVARWLAVLCDRGFFSFAACIWPSEALAVASGQCNGDVKLALYVFQGPKFSTLSPSLMTNEERGAFSGLLRSLHNTWGLWRLEKVLRKYHWIDHQETDFYVASSSVGTSLDAKFLAAFAAAAGRRAESITISQESDPQWGCWTAEQEAADPSIGIVFPSINRVQQDNFVHYGLLCFAESAWLRMKSANLLHDAVPYPSEREGFPMHIKIAWRRFQDLSSSRPYGWMYCGSHNFSPAAWGRPIWKAKDWEAATDAGSVLGSSLHICNYELGIVLIEPPPDDNSSKSKNDSEREGLDRFVLPFKVPPPIYADSDRPATGKAMVEAYLEMRALQLKAAAEEDLAVMQSEDLGEEVSNVPQEDAACNAEREEARAEQVYVEALWSQIDEEQKTDEDAADKLK